MQEKRPRDGSLLSRSVHDAIFLTTKAELHLKREGINTIGQLIEKSAEELLRNRRLGNKSLIQIREELAKLGLCLKGEY